MNSFIVILLYAFVAPTELRVNYTAGILGRCELEILRIHARDVENTTLGKPSRLLNLPKSSLTAMLGNPGHLQSDFDITRGTWPFLLYKPRSHSKLIARSIESWMRGGPGPMPDDPRYHDPRWPMPDGMNQDQEQEETFSEDPYWQPEADRRKGTKDDHRVITREHRRRLYNPELVYYQRRRGVAHNDPNDNDWPEFDNAFKLLVSTKEGIRLQQRLGNLDAIGEFWNMNGKYYVPPDSEDEAWDNAVLLNETPAPDQDDVWITPPPVIDEPEGIAADGPKRNARKRNEPTISPLQRARSQTLPPEIYIPPEEYFDSNTGESLGFEMPEFEAQVRAQPIRDKYERTQVRAPETSFEGGEEVMFERTASGIVARPDLGLSDETGGKPKAKGKVARSQTMAVSSDPFRPETAASEASAPEMSDTLSGEPPGSVAPKGSGKAKGKAKAKAKGKAKVKSKVKRKTKRKSKVVEPDAVIVEEPKMIEIQWTDRMLLVLCLSLCSGVAFRIAYRVSGS